MKPLLLFDLGNVIVRWDGITRLALKTGQSKSWVKEKFSDSAILSAYEIGQCDDETFLKELILVFSLDMPLRNAAQVWQDWVGPAYPNTLQTLKSLRSGFELACLSNTNRLHWEILPQRIDMGAVFDVQLASHHMGLAKPDPNIFIKACEVLKRTPNGIVFFDDSWTNIAAAKDCGMEAHWVDPKNGVIPVLLKEGYGASGPLA